MTYLVQSVQMVSSVVSMPKLKFIRIFFQKGEDLQVLRTGCFKYFERGGECTNGPVSLLSALVLSRLFQDTLVH